MRHATLVGVIEPLADILRANLSDVTGPVPLDLLLDAVAERALSRVAGESLARAGRDPLVDRAVRTAYLEAFKEFAAQVFGGHLGERITHIERELEDGIIPA